MRIICNLAAAGLLVCATAAAQSGTGPAPSGTGDAENSQKVFSKPFVVPDGVDIDRLKDAAQDAATQVWDGYVQDITDAKILRFAVLPLQRDLDGEYVALQLRNKFTEICGPRGLELYTRMDQQWNTLLREIAWGENFGDTMDAATIQKFGRINGVQALVFPRIVGATKTDHDGVKLRVNVQVFEVETGRQLWGREIVAVKEGTLVPLLDRQFIHDHREWIIYGGIAAGAVILLVLVLRMVARVSRPR